MSKKFIPNGDVDFVTKAESFAREIVADPERFEIPREEADALAEAVKSFRAALQAHQFGGRSKVTAVAKDEARTTAVRIMRRIGHLVRSNLRIDAATKVR